MADNVQFSNLRGVPFILQPAGSAAAAPGNVAAIPSGYLHHSVYITGSAGVASGAVTIETADDPAYAGTWAAVQAAVTVLASTELIISFIGEYLFIRARISTVIGSGTVGVKLVSSFG